MLARVVRNGLVEATHDGAVAAFDGAGQLVASCGDPNRHFFLRSASKPFQATVAQVCGADLTAQQMALACASHGGRPVHIAIVSRMLREVGLDERHLLCPPAWPFGEGAAQRPAVRGYRAAKPIWHNCSGKHAAMLRTCVAAGRPVDDYVDPGHLLPVKIAAKHGAEASLGVAVRARMGSAVKLWEGSPRATGVGMVAALDQLGLLVGPAREAPAGIGRPPVLGRGMPQGAIEPLVELAW